MALLDPFAPRLDESGLAVIDAFLRGTAPGAAGLVFRLKDATLTCEGRLVGVRISVGGNHLRGWLEGSVGPRPGVIAPPGAGGRDRHVARVQDMLLPRTPDQEVQIRTVLREAARLVDRLARGGWSRMYDVVRWQLESKVRRRFRRPGWTRFALPALADVDFRPDAWPDSRGLIQGFATVYTPGAPDGGDPVMVPELWASPEGLALLTPAKELAEGQRIPLWQAVQMLGVSVPHL